MSMREYMDRQIKIALWIAARSGEDFDIVSIRLAPVYRRKYQPLRETL